MGWWVSAIVFLIIEPENRFVRFHAIQSLVVFGILTVAWAILGSLPYVGWFFSAVIGLLGFALWVALMVKAYNGARYKLYWAGDVAERHSGEPQNRQ